MIDWSGVDTVLLDMDGVLLDLRFDNWFWREHVPNCYAEQHQIPLEQARSAVYPKMRAIRGTIDWYCVEYWSSTLGLDIVTLKSEAAHRVAVRPEVERFLEALRHFVPAVYLVTNAHPHTIDIKCECTGIDQYFDEIISSHTYRVPKESAEFWHAIFDRYDLDADSTLFVDDNIDVLRAARDHGIRHLFSIHQPDSGLPGTEHEEFHAIRAFSEIVPWDAAAEASVGAVRGSN